MSSHHHNNCQHSPTATACGGCCSCYNHHCCTPPPQTHQLPTDPLLQSLASLLLQHQHHQEQQQQHNNLHSFYTNKPHNTTQIHHRNPKSFHFQQQKDPISSLLHRISTLEYSLNEFLTAKTRSFPSYSVRDAAARVIQTHFRAFLVHRSRTLRDLKELALVKSSFNYLHSSVLKETHFDSESVSRKAMDLLLKLDSIQGSDPMIRDGKRSVSRDLVRFLDHVDGFNVKMHGVSRKYAKVGRVVRNGNNCKASIVKRGHGDSSGNHKESWEDLRGRVEKLRERLEAHENVEEGMELEEIVNGGDDDDKDREDKDEEEDNYGLVAIKGRSGISRDRNGVVIRGPRVKKTVSFAENGNVYTVFDNSHDQVSNEDVSTNDSIASDDDHEMANNYSRVAGKINEIRKGAENEAANSEDGGCPSNIDDERNLRRKGRDSGGHYADGNLYFSAPEPVQMESRSNLVKKR